MTSSPSSFQIRSHSGVSGGHEFRGNTTQPLYLPYRWFSGSVRSRDALLSVPGRIFFSLHALSLPAGLGVSVTGKGAHWLALLHWYPLCVPIKRKARAQGNRETLSKG